MGAAYSSLGRTKGLYTTSLVLLGAKAKFLRRKPSVLVDFEDGHPHRVTFSHIEFHLPTSFPLPLASEVFLQGQTVLN